MDGTHSISTIDVDLGVFYPANKYEHSSRIRYYCSIFTAEVYN